MKMKPARLYKHIAFLSMAAVILLLAVATVVEKFHGTEFVNRHFYHAPWMLVLWGIVAHFGMFYIMRKRLYRRAASFLIHAALLLILIGAFVTHRHGVQGRIHLRVSQPVDQFSLDEETEQSLPFSIVLERFELKYHKGSSAPMDYVSRIRIKDGEQEKEGSVSMNQIFTHKHYRFYQSGYDADGQGAVLSVNFDPWGISITYTAYLLLFVGMCFFFFERGSAFRRLLNHPLLSDRRLLAVFLLPLFPLSLHSRPPTLSSAEADAFGRISVYYNDRICPMQTLAYDFMRKVCGTDSYKGLSPEQMLSGLFFHYDSWKNEPFILIKEKQVRDILGIEGKYASLSDFTSSYGYKLQHALSSEDGSLRRAAEKSNEKFNLVSMLCTGSLLKIYPISPSDSTALKWYALTDRLPDTLAYDHWLFIKQSMNLVAEQVAHRNDSAVISLLDKIGRYQRKTAANEMPSQARMNAERLYTISGFAPFPALAAVVAGVVGLLLFIFFPQMRKSRRLRLAMVLFSSLLFVFLTFRIGLRWYVSGHVPLSNGHETLAFLAWVSVLAALILGNRIIVLRPVGLLLCGISMMVSVMGQQTPQITPLMPVLHSPLLSIHVALIMLAYCLLAFAMLCAAAAILSRFTSKDASDQTDYLAVVSRIMLYPAVFLLAAGIFVGAVWANISWGRYWGWDPKEVWALVTMLIYALPLHTDSLRFFRSSMHYHAYMLVAFLAVVMTYFGVNCLLGGMHSYAG